MLYNNEALILTNLGKQLWLFSCHALLICPAPQHVCRTMCTVRSFCISASQPAGQFVQLITHSGRAKNYFCSIQKMHVKLHLGYHFHDIYCFGKHTCINPNIHKTIKRSNEVKQSGNNSSKRSTPMPNFCSIVHER